MTGAVERLLTTMNENEPCYCNKSVELCLVDSKTIRKLNKTYFGKDAVTDILSYPNSFPQSDSLGELVVNLDDLIPENELRHYGEYLLKPGSNQKYEFEDDAPEIIPLLVHGILHLLGYDHINTGKAKEMDAKQSYYLQTINYNVS